MAEFITDATGTRLGPRPSDEITDAGLGAMGHPIPLHRRQTAVDHCRMMGMTDNVAITACVGAMADRLERDEPYEAMREACRYVDLTGAYRLMACLLTGDEPPRPSTTEAMATLAAGDSLRVAENARAAVVRARLLTDKARKERDRAIERANERAKIAIGRARQSKEASRREFRLKEERMAEEFEARVEAEVRKRMFGPVEGVNGHKRRPIVL